MESRILPLHTAVAFVGMTQSSQKPKVVLKKDSANTVTEGNSLKASLRSPGPASGITAMLWRWCCSKVELTAWVARSLPELLVLRVFIFY